MLDFKNKFPKIKKTHVVVAAVVLLIVLAACLLWFNHSTSMQSEASMVAQVYFDGDYRIAEGEWQPTRVSF